MLKFIVFILIIFSFSIVNSINYNFAVIDYIRVEREANVYKELNKLIEKERSKIQEELYGCEINLRKEKKALDKLKESGRVFDKEKKMFEKKVMQVQATINQMKAQLSNMVKVASSLIKQELDDILKKFTEREGKLIILKKSQVLFFNKELDITDVILNILNQRMSKVPVLS